MCPVAAESKNSKPSSKKKIIKKINTKKISNENPFKILKNLNLS